MRYVQSLHTNISEFYKLHKQIIREFIGFKMQHFQGIVSI